jgi:hypothetical protein
MSCTVDEHVELLDRDRVAAHRHGEHTHHRVGGIARTGLAETAAVVVEARVARRPAFEIRIVVHLTGEVVERIDGGALLPWQGDESPVEVGRLATRHVLTESLRGAHAGKRGGVKHAGL